MFENDRAAHDERKTLEVQDNDAQFALFEQDARAVTPPEDTSGHLLPDLAIDSVELLASDEQEDHELERSTANDKGITSLPTHQQKTLQDLQTVILLLAERSGDKEQFPPDLIKGIERERQGKNDQPIFGTDTEKGLATYVAQLQRETIPALFKELLESGAAVPAGLPLRSTTYKTGSFAGKPMPAEAIVRAVVEDRMQLDLGIETSGITHSDQLEKLVQVSNWIVAARNRLQENSSSHMREIARRRIEEMKLPKWDVSTNEQAAAAMIVMSQLKECAVLIQAREALKKDVSVDSEQWLAPLKPGNLPPGIEIERNREKITAIRFADLPDQLDIQSPAVRDRMRTMMEWCSENRPSIDNIAGELKRVNGKPLAAYAWKDVPMDKQWVQKCESWATHPAMRSTQPTGDQWSETNLLERRCRVEDRKNPSSGADEVRVTGTTRFCYSQSPWNLYKPAAVGVADYKVDSGWVARERMLAVETGSGKIEFMPAGEMQDFISEESFWHHAGKAVTITMDTSMILGGSATLSMGRRALSATRRATAMELSGAGAAIPSVARLQEIAANSSSMIQRGYKELVLGGTGLIPDSDLQQVRGMILLTDVARGTLIDPAARGIRNVLGKASDSTNSDAVLQSIRNSGSSLVRVAEKTGHYGFAVSQVPFIVEAARELRHKIDTLHKSDLSSLDELTLPADTKSGARSAGAGGFSDTVEGLSRFAASLPLSADDRQTATKLLDEMKSLTSLELDSLSGDRAQNQVGDDELLNKPDTASQRRLEFFSTKVAPLLLADTRSLVEHEQRRRTKLVLTNPTELQRQPFTPSEVVHKMEQKVQSGASGAMKSFLAAAALTLTEPLGTDIIYSRTSKIGLPDLHFGGAVPGLASLINQIPEEGEVVQYLKSSELLPLVEKNLSGQSADVRIAAGDLAIRLGTPREVYASALKELFEKKLLQSDEQKREVLVRLAGAGLSIQTTERENKNAAPDSQALYRTLQGNNSSEKISRFISEVGQSCPLALRSNALFLSSLLNRHLLDEVDLVRFESYTKQYKTFGANDISALALGDLRKEVSSPADAERMLHAVAMLSCLADGDGRLEVEVDGAKSTLSIRDAGSCFSQISAYSQQLDTRWRECRLKVEQLQRLSEQLENPAQAKSPEAIRVNERLEKATSELLQSQSDRAMAFEVALNAARMLSNSASKQGLAVDAARLGVEARSSVRECLLNFLQGESAATGKPRLADVNAKIEAIALVKKLLDSERNVSSGSTGTGASKSTLDKESFRQEKELLSFLRRVIAPGNVGVSVGEKQPPALNSVAKARRIDSQAILLPLSPSEPRPAALRIKAIETLASFGDRRSFDLAASLLSPQTEPDASIRLAAARHLMALTPDGAERVHAIFEDSLRRGAETDLAVLAFMRGKIGSALIGDESLARKVVIEDSEHELSQTKVNRDRIQRLLHSSEYQWLTASNLREQVRSAKDNTYNFWTYMGDRTAWLPGAPMTAMRELKKQREVIGDFQARFNELATTAFETGGQKGKEARELLYYIATASGDEWEMSAASRSAQLNAGHTDRNIFIDRDVMEVIRVRAAEALSNCVKDLHSKKGLQSESLAQLHSMLLDGLKNEAASAVAKLHLISGLEAIHSAGGEKNGAVLGRRSERFVAESLRELVRQEPPVESSDWQAQQTLALRMIDFLKNTPLSKSTLTDLEAISLRGVTAPRQTADFLAPIGHACRELVADTSQSVRRAYNRNRSSNRDFSDKERVELLNAACQLVAVHETNKSERTPLTGRAEQEAIEKVFAATAALSAVQNPSVRSSIESKLLEVLNHASSSDRLRVAAAIASLQPGCERREEALTRLVTFALSQGAYGLRRDAQEALKSLSNSDDLKMAERILVAQKDAYISQMSSKLTGGADTLTDYEVIEQHREKSASEKQLSAVSKETLATTFSLLSGVQRNLNRHAEAFETASVAVNLFLDQAPLAEFERNELTGNIVDGALARKLAIRHGGSEVLPVVTDACENLGRAAQYLRPNFADAQFYLAAALQLRQQSFGARHVDTMKCREYIVDAHLNEARMYEHDERLACRNARDTATQIEQLRKQLVELSPGVADSSTRDESPEIKDLRRKIAEDEAIVAELQATQQSLLTKSEIALNFAAKLQQEHTERLASASGSGATSERVFDSMLKRLRILQHTNDVRKNLIDVTPSIEAKNLLRTQLDSTDKYVESSLLNAVKSDAQSAVSTARKYRVSEELSKYYSDKGEFGKCREQLKSMVMLSRTDAERTALYNRLAQVSLNMSDTKSANAYLSSQSMMARRAYRPDSKEMADSIASQVRLLELSGQHALALEQSARARSLHQGFKSTANHNTRESAGLISDYEDLAFVQRNSGDESAAQISISTAIGLAVDSGDMQKVVDLSLELAIRQVLAGKQGEARATLKRLYESAVKSGRTLVTGAVADALKAKGEDLAPNASKSITDLMDWMIELY